MTCEQMSEMSNVSSIVSSVYLRLPHHDNQYYFFDRARFLYYFPTSMVAEAIKRGTDADSDEFMIDIPDASVTPEAVQYLSALVAKGMVTPFLCDRKQLEGAYRYLGIELFGLLMDPTFNISEILPYLSQCETQGFYIQGQVEKIISKINLIDPDWLQQHYTAVLDSGSVPLIRYMFAISPAHTTADEDQKFLREDHQKSPSMSAEVLAMLLRRNVDPTWDHQMILSYHLHKGHTDHVIALLKSGKVDPTLDDHRAVFELFDEDVPPPELFEVFLEDKRVNPMARNGMLLVEAIRHTRDYYDPAKVLLLIPELDVSSNDNLAFRLAADQFNDDIMKMIVSHQKFDPNRFSYLHIMNLGQTGLKLLRTHKGINSVTQSYITEEIGEENSKPNPNHHFVVK